MNPKFLTTLGVALAATVILTGCVVAVGNRDSRPEQTGTLGQQLIDLQRAKDAGVITDAEYQTQKAKLLGTKAK